MLVGLKQSAMCIMRAWLMKAGEERHRVVPSHATRLYSVMHMKLPGPPSGRCPWRTKSIPCSRASRSGDVACMFAMPVGGTCSRGCRREPDCTQARRPSLAEPPRVDSRCGSNKGTFATLHRVHAENLTKSSLNEFEKNIHPQSASAIVNGWWTTRSTAHARLARLEM